MRKASTWMLEKGTQDAVPFSRPHPRSKPQTVAENLHGNWNIERGHVNSTSMLHNHIFHGVACAKLRALSNGIKLVNRS